MTSRLNPYIGFKDNAREAMEFYQQVFGGDLQVSTFGEYQVPDPNPDKLMHAMLTTDLGFTLMGADTPEGMPYEEGSSRVTISLSGDDADALRGYWDALAEGGQVAVPFEQQMWGDTFGMCTDKYGVAWMVDIVGTAPSE